MDGRLGTGSSPHTHCAFTEDGGQLELRVVLPVVFALSLFNRDIANMKAFLSLLLLGLVSLVQALSSTGNRLLVVLEEAADKSKYSSFFGDLECKLYLLIPFAKT